MTRPTALSLLENLDYIIQDICVAAMLGDANATTDTVEEGRVLSIAPMPFDTPFRADESLVDFKRPLPCGLLSAPRIRTEFPQDSGACTLLLDYQWVYATASSGRLELDSDAYRRRLCFANYDLFQGAFFRRRVQVPGAPTHLPSIPRVVPGEAQFFTPTKEMTLFGIQFSCELRGYAPRELDE